ncbi:hypothetical protein TW83_09950 [Paracoccus sp. S4493]|uniref:major capsid protein n=1 Tax=Paracoccus sp. S4493 TaxID=579490 RepID=UPI0005FA533A|nr:minor capsid protein E [Paracoccus sp. S4493]KJZ31235.1 hypothetical protein TW83_09950 [Paracoccus sp. S4493]
MLQSQPLTNGQVKLVAEMVHPKPRLFRERWFSKTHLAERDTVVLEDLPDGKNIVAPFVSPYDPGKPSRTRGGETRALKTGYIRLNDTIDPFKKSTTTTSDPFSIFSATPQTVLPVMRKDTIADQRSKVDNALEFMSVQAAFDGKFTVYGDGVPTAEVDFRRDPNLTVVKEPGAYWGDADVSIIEDIQKFTRAVKKAERGGVVTVILVGSNVADHMVKSARKGGELHDLLDTRYSVDSSFLRGVRSNENVVYLGRISNSIDVIEYTEEFTVVNKNGDEELIKPLGDNEIVLLCDNIGGVMAFGPIRDREAQYQPIPVFTRNYITTGSPSHEVVSTESAPLAVLGFANRTMKVTVMAPTAADPEE